MSSKKKLLNHTSKTKDYPSTVSAQEACFYFVRIMIFILATTPKQKIRGAATASYGSLKRNTQRYDYE